MLTTALGPSIAAMLDAPDTIEVIANPDGRLWLEQVGKGRIATPHRLEASETERVIRLVATLTGAEVNRDTPIVSAELPPRGERFEGVLPPVSRGPCFAIRKPAGRVFTLDDYLASGVITPTQAATLRAAVRDHANIMVAGGTGSGKTTLANALLHEIAQLGERVVILEDTRELQCAAEDVVALRGPEALDLLKAWNTGHPGGIATLHANSAQAALSRLEQLTMEVCETPPRALIAEAIDLIVFVERGGPAGRRIPEILAPKGLPLQAPDHIAPQPGARGANALVSTNRSEP